MSRKTKRGTAAAHKQNVKSEQGRASSIGRWFFLASAFLTPLVIGVLPTSLGPVSQFVAYDPIGLPKVVTLAILSGIAFIALWVSVARGESDVYWHPVMWILAALIGWAGISTIFSASPAASVLGHVHNWHGFVAIATYGLLVFLTIQYIRTARDLRAFMVAAVAAGSIVALYAVAQFSGLDAIGWVGETSRVFSTHGNADMLGNYLVFPLALSVGLALSTPRGRERYAWWSLMALIAMALIMTMTIGAWIGATVMVLGLGYAVWRGGSGSLGRRMLVLSATTVGVLVLAAAVAVARRPDIIARLANSWPLITRLSNGRDVIWLTGLRGWLTRPILGWGPDGFARAFQRGVGADWYAITPALQVVIDAHNFLVHTLVTLGIPGLVLMLWALVRTGTDSFASFDEAKGLDRMLRIAPWAALLSMATALSFGVSGTIVSVWMWGTVGLLLAPLSHRIATPTKPLIVASAVASAALMLWAGSWMVADVHAGYAAGLPIGPAQVAELRAASRINPLQPTYRWQAAEASLKALTAERDADMGDEQFDAEMRRVLAEYQTVVDADPGDVHIRIAQATLLISYAAAHPGAADGVQRALSAALEAQKRAPRNPAALCVLARAYEVAGHLEEAESAARLARSIAPAYSMQTLGPRGLGTTVAP